LSALRTRNLTSSLLTLAVTGPALAAVAVATAAAAPASAAARPAIVASTSHATGASAAASAGQARQSALVRAAKPLAAASPPASAGTTNGGTTNGGTTNGGPPHRHTGKPAKHKHRHRHLTPRRMAWSMLHHFGWRHRQFKYLNRLWNRESGWNVYAANPYSGAYGIPQAVPGSKMASAGKKWRTSARVQIRWGLRYIRARYGSPQGAWDHEVNTGWY
jgi:hypothetical protein